MIFKGKRNFYFVCGGILLAILTISCFFYIRYGSREEKGTIEVNGRIEGDEISVSAKIAGEVLLMPWKEGRRIEKGQLVARISSDQIRARLDGAEARWNASGQHVREKICQVKVLEKEVELARIRLKLATEQSEACINQAVAALEVASAIVKEEEGDLIKAANDNQRYIDLFEKKAISDQLLEKAGTDYNAALSRKEVAEKQLRNAEAGLRLARSTIIDIELKKKELESAITILEQARSSLAGARAEAKALEAARNEAKAVWADTEVYAPLSGTVITKVTDQGEYVVPGSPIIILIDLENLYLKAYLKKIDIGKIRLANPARIYMDAFPDRFFEATISEISQQAEFTPKNVYIKEERVKLVFGVKLLIKNSEGYLKPGMPCDAEILWNPDAEW